MPVNAQAILQIGFTANAPERETRDELGNK
jgi:hypothetical protein